MDCFLILPTVLYHKLLPYFILVLLYSSCSLLSLWRANSFFAHILLYKHRKTDGKLAKGVRKGGHWPHVENFKPRYSMIH